MLNNTHLEPAPCRPAHHPHHRSFCPLAPAAPSSTNLARFSSATAVFFTFAANAAAPNFASWRLLARYSLPAALVPSSSPPHSCPLSRCHLSFSSLTRTSGSNFLSCNPKAGLGKALTLLALNLKHVCIPTGKGGLYIHPTKSPPPLV
ncbi:hypothetical protein PCANC_06827 [Puccinia coronata f. sp. avenae]|uniref:Uncharacterized protein n=1 Tax=Puccinia coronata f. sp. avenae TaxID=200324 RepID=A0A2N5VVI3_9BASI|nr:hypothetical protein PCANC_06827 [Puccinia coronata f. sp. avenae]